MPPNSKFRWVFVKPGRGRTIAAGLGVQPFTTRLFYCAMRCCILWEPRGARKTTGKLWDQQPPAFKEVCHCLCKARCSQVVKRVVAINVKLLAAAPEAKALKSLVWSRSIASVTICFALLPAGFGGWGQAGARNRAPCRLL